MARRDDLEPPLRDEPPFSIVVHESARRRRTVGAQLKGDVLTITVPEHMGLEEIGYWVGRMERRFARRLSTERIDLVERAAALARRHDLPTPTTIRWSADMRTRWGSCTPSSAAIRISDRLAGFPDWVIDYVIVHELAHLVVAAHNRRFWALVERYPRAERARGYLIAKSGDAEIE